MNSVEKDAFVIDLPLSKSEANRALMMMYYSDQRLPSYDNAADDVLMLRSLLQSIKNHDGLGPLTLDCGNAGTVLRFLMTAVSTIDDCMDMIRRDRYILTGSERMKSRPVGDLVDALRNLGVSVEYMECEGYPPVVVRGCRIDGGRVEVSAEHSSQFASSLLLAAPLWKNGLELYLTGNVSSSPYIDMTIDMMKKYGVDVVRNDRNIVVKHGRYRCGDITVEPDWSSAAFWYEFVTVSDKEVSILFKNLDINSKQADVAAVKMFETLGVETVSYEDGVVIRKSTRQQDNKTTSRDVIHRVHRDMSFHFSDCPDLFPAVIAACAGLKIDAKFTGLRNLSIKESDRKKAMMTELKKINISFEDVSDDVLIMRSPEELPSFSKENPIIFDTYGDHRVAMSLAILSSKIGNINIDDKDVVRKSYPDFWEDFTLTI